MFQRVIDMDYEKDLVNKLDVEMQKFKLEETLAFNSETLPPEVAKKMRKKLNRINKKNTVQNSMNSEEFHKELGICDSHSHHESSHEHKHKKVAQQNTDEDETVYKVSVSKKNNNQDIEIEDQAEYDLPVGTISPTRNILSINVNSPTPLNVY